MKWFIIVNFLINLFLLIWLYRITIEINLWANYLTKKAFYIEQEAAQIKQLQEIVDTHSSYIANVTGQGPLTPKQCCAAKNRKHI